MYIYMFDLYILYILYKSFKGDIKNCLTLVVKAESLKSITRRQKIYAIKAMRPSSLHASCCAYKLF